MWLGPSALCVGAICIYPEVSIVVNFWGYVFERVESPGLWYCS